MIVQKSKIREKHKDPRKAERPEKSGKTREKRKGPRKAFNLVFKVTVTLALVLKQTLQM